MTGPGAAGGKDVLHEAPGSGEKMTTKTHGANCGIALLANANAPPSPLCGWCDLQAERKDAAANKLIFAGVPRQPPVRIYWGKTAEDAGIDLHDRYKVTLREAAKAGLQDDWAPAAHKGREVLAKLEIFLESEGIIIDC